MSFKLNAKKLKDNLYSSILILTIVIVLVLLSVFAEGFFSVNNLTNVLRQVSVLGLLVLGVSPIIIIGNIDLSLAIIMTNAAIVGVSIIQRTGSVSFGILTIIAIGVFIGAFNGFFIGKLKVVSFIVTFSVMMVGSGFAAWYTRAISIANLPEYYRLIGNGQIGFIPYSFIIYLVFVFITHLLLNNHYVGRMIYSIGVNPKASKLTGIPIEVIVLFIFIYAGFLASLAGMIQSAKLGSASAAMGRQGMILDYIAAATVGGISIKGGKGHVYNALMGTFLIVLLTNSMNLLGINYYVTLIIKGFILVLIVGLEINRRKVTNKL